MDERSAPARLRLFAALHVPREPAEQLATYATALQDRLPGTRVTDPDALHITFAFLGDVAEDDTTLVARAIDEASARVPGPTLCSASLLAAFGGGRALGIEIEVELLALLNVARDGFLEQVAPIAPELDRRPWLPHVTILRGAQRGTLRVRELATPPLPSVSWVAPDLRLYASLPGPGGHQHRLLHAVPFGASVPSS